MRISPLFTDFYQFSMFESYVREGMALTEASFDVFFRKAPDGAPFAIACGLETVLDFLRQFQFQEEEFAFLKREQILSRRSIEGLRAMDLSTVNIWAVPEGTPVLPRVPMLRLEGPIGLLQVLESPVLNILNFETLIATKTSRMVRSAAPASVTEFGLRRAQGFSAALQASRAAFISGAMATSNVEAAYRFGIPAKGTMSHAYVMSFPDELSAFRAFVRQYPTSAVLLVDTFDTLTCGLPHAIQVAKELKGKGGMLSGIRLDSGDLVAISQGARHLLDQAGLSDVHIVASNELDEFQIVDIQRRGGCMDGYGVGTKLVTAYSEPALGGVYKLVAVKEQGEWHPKIKISSDKGKTTLPGRKVILRVLDGHAHLCADIIALEGEDCSSWSQFHPLEEGQTVFLPLSWTRRPLLQKVWGDTAYVSPSLSDIRTHCAHQLATLPSSALALSHPHPIPVVLSPEAEKMFDLATKKWRQS